MYAYLSSGKFARVHVYGVPKLTKIGTLKHVVNIIMFKLIHMVKVVANFVSIGMPNIIMSQYCIFFFFFFSDLPHRGV